jgi:hypothetical protein
MGIPSGRILHGVIDFIFLEECATVHRSAVEDITISS